MVQPDARARIDDGVAARRVVGAGAAIVAASCLACSIALGGPLPPGGATPATLEQTLRALEASSRQAPSGIYALESSIDFNALDAVNYDPATGRISLMGHLDPRFAERRIPYLQHLAALLEIRDPRKRVHFTLPTPPSDLSAVKNKVSQQVAQQQHPHEKFLAHFADTFDDQGVVTHLGSEILTALGLSPVTGHRRPGYFGASVEPLASGAVRVVSLFEGSPADQAGLHAGDEIVRFDGKVPYSARELERLARFGGAGNKITVVYRRNGQPTKATVALLPDDVPDLWLQATRWDVDAALYRASGKQQRADIAYLLGVLASGMVQPTRLAVLSALDRGSAAADQRTDTAAESDLAHKVAQQLDGTFGLEGNPLLGAYEAEFSASHRVDRALGAALRAFQMQTPSTVDRLRDFAFNNPTGFDIPPSLFDVVYGSHAETKPDYFGEATDTPLARVLLEGDYTLKMLPYRPDLKERLPGYQTAFEYDDTHPSSAADVYERVWLSVDKMDVAQSASGTTLVIRNAVMRINTQIQTADGTRDARAKAAHGYVDVLNAHYDELAADHPVLHEAREVAKLAAVAEWIRKKTPDFRLPKEGRVAWAAPAKVPSIGYMHFQRSGATTLHIATHVEGGVNLTPVPLGSVGLVIPMDRGAPELRDVANVQTPSPAAVALGADGKWPGGWTTQTTANGRKESVATIVPPKQHDEMWRDAVSGVVADKATVDQRERKLRAQMASDQGSPQQQAADALQLAQVLSGKGDNAGALAMAKKAEALQPHSPVPLYYEAQYEQNAQDSAAATASLTKAVALKPDNPKANAWLNRLKADEQNGIIPANANAAPVTRPSPSDGQGGQGGQVAVPMGVRPDQAGLTPVGANAADPAQARQAGSPTTMGPGSNRTLRTLEVTLGEQRGGNAGQASGCYDGSEPGCRAAAPAAAVAVSVPTAQAVPGPAPKPLDPITARNNIQRQINAIQSKPEQTPDDKLQLQQLNRDFQQVQAKIDNPQAPAVPAQPASPAVDVPAPQPPKQGPPDTVMDSN